MCYRLHLFSWRHSSRSGLPYWRDSMIAFTLEISFWQTILIRVWVICRMWRLLSRRRSSGATLSSHSPSRIPIRQRVAYCYARSGPIVLPAVSHLLGERIHGVFASVTSPGASTFTCGSMECTSTSGWRTTGSAPWSDRRAAQRREGLAVADGYRESAESWKALLRELKRRGMTAPALAVGDGALGFWAAVREVWPETRAQACWCHKLGNVLDKLPKRLQPRAKRALHEMMYAESRAECESARLRFAAEYQAKYPKAVESLIALSTIVRNSPLWII